MQLDKLKLRDDSQGLIDLVEDLESRYRRMQRKDRGELLSVAFGAKLLVTNIVGDQEIPFEMRRGLLNLDSATGALKRLGDLLLEVGNDLRVLGLQSNAEELETIAHRLSHGRLFRIDTETEEARAHIGGILAESEGEFVGDAARKLQQQREFKRSA